MHKFNISFTGQQFKEQKTRQIRTDIKQTTLAILLEAVYCQEVDPFSFVAACDLLQVALYYKFDHVIKITVKFLVRCSRHRCPDACCKFEGISNSSQFSALTESLADDVYIKTALGRFQEREYYLNNTVNLQHTCDILFLFLRHIDEHMRLEKMFEAIKESLIEWDRPIINVLKVTKALEFTTSDFW